MQQPCESQRGFESCGRQRKIVSACAPDTLYLTYGTARFAIKHLKEYMACVAQHLPEIATLGQPLLADLSS